MMRYFKIVNLFVTVTCLWADDEIATTFTYTDPAAKTVEVAGEFSNWKTLPMAKDATGIWTKTLRLRDGQYGYKLVVDGEWKLDPKNPARKVVNDLENSAVTVGNVRPPAPVASATGTGSVTLKFTDARAKTVHVAGDFNQWLDNVEGKVTGKSEWIMQSAGAGKWNFVVTLPAGRYKFKYVIDGGDHWSLDPNFPASDDDNSVLEIKVTEAANSAAAVTNTTFTYADPTAKTVFIAGQFNDWNATANPLKKDKSGLWTVTIPLKAGKQMYKLIVDGDWRVDPANADSVDDGEGNMNSVRMVAP